MSEVQGRAIVAAQKGILKSRLTKAEKQLALDRFSDPDPELRLEIEAIKSQLKNLDYLERLWNTGQHDLFAKEFQAYKGNHPIIH